MPQPEHALSGGGGKLARAKSFAQIILAAALAAYSAPKPELAIAAAANLSAVCPLLAGPFEAETGIHPVFSFGSTAQLAQQIENGAPFDVFLAADAEHPRKLDSEGFLTNRAPYATGVLALWIPPGGHAKILRLQDLASPEVRVIAVAKPELAPYGQAAVETLKKVGLWDRVQPKIVYADNIGMAKQYGASGNADAVFTAWSLVLRESSVIPVEEALHRPIAQELGIVAKSPNARPAQAFIDFILTGKGRDILAANGYRTRGQ